MASGLKALHDIDSALAKARTSVAQASRLPGQASNALAEVSRKKALAYGNIAKLRLEFLEDDKGGDLGYVDRQAVKLLAAHDKLEQGLIGKADASLDKIAKIETDRRAQEKSVVKAVEAYDKKAEACQKLLIADPHYITLLAAVETAEATTERAIAKQSLAQDDVAEKGAPYLADPYFLYLQKRGYGTRQAKGWFLTKMLDGWIARRGKYLEAALNYKRLLEIPKRLASHVKALEDKEVGARKDLENAESDMLVREGVEKLKEVSLTQQAVLDKIDVKLEAQEHAHQTIRSQQAEASSGQTGPYKEAIALLVNTLENKRLPDLRRLAAQTISNDDDRAIGKLIELSRLAKDLEQDRKEATSLLRKYQNGLESLEKLRRKFKNRRYDAPSSTFPSRNLVGALALQLVSGMLSGNDVWRQIERAQRTVRRHSDSDFGGIDWTEAMRLPRNMGGFGGSSDHGGWGGTTSRRRTTRRRSPRINLPRSSGSRSSGRSGRRGGGGFHTKGGF
ncbi:MAG: hypothetical protein COA43_12860 [Robiginitomaculum sp.]|nr:MAG: hypothetical protein COA43_12860 [Robiginitomaculum sp.]